MAVDLTKLNTSQKEAVEYIDGPSLVIAGAGSGKTRVLTSKIAYLIESGISPYEILALTFTNKAANEMKERIIKLVGKSAETIWMGTFHSMFARILRMEAGLIGFTRDFTIYDTDDSLGVIKAIMNEKNLSSEKINPKSIQGFISNLKNRFILPSEFQNLSKSFFENIVSEVYTSYFDRLRKCNSMDFDDLLIYPLILFNKYEDVLGKYRERFKFILIDEFQDTNTAQYSILNLLAQKYKNITVVGDDAQSIYRWRGAEIQNIFDFQEDFTDHRIFRLEQNYRSTKNILDLAGLIISKNQKQIEKNLWTEKNEGEKITVLEAATDKDESAKITKYISSEIHERKINFKDVAILYRTNAQSRSFEEFFRLNGIPYIIVGGIRFYERKEIKDILAHLRIIANSYDEESLVRVLLLKEGLGRTSVDKLRQIAAEKNLQLSRVLFESEDVSVISSRARNKILEVLNFINKYRYLKEEMKLVELVKSVIDETGIVYTLKQENTNESDERINNINELINAVAQFVESSDEPFLENFLTQVSLVSDIDEVDEKKNAVTLMTIHSAKGLEFPVVFISGLEEGLFPGNNSMNSLEELEEERRLFYVAVTRAEIKLYITYAEQRFRFGTKMFQVKSKFLREIEDECGKKNLFKYDSHKIYKHSNVSGLKSKSRSIKINFGKVQKEESSHDDTFSDIVKGRKIFHETFGSGIVLAIHGKAMDKKADILFDDVGLKRIILKFAKLRVNLE
jgi:DNA helicase II / ATP-dependent DNA helicase PcrA